MCVVPSSGAPDPVHQCLLCHLLCLHMLMAMEADGCGVLALLLGRNSLGTGLGALSSLKHLRLSAVFNCMWQSEGGTYSKGCLQATWCVKEAA